MIDWFGAMILGVLGNLLTAEFGAAAPRIADALSRLGSRLVPARHRERLREEWAAYIADVALPHRKVAAGFGFVFAAIKIRGEASAWGVPRLIDLFVAVSSLVLLLPLLLALGLAIRITSQGPVFYRGKRFGKDGEIFGLVRFRTMYVAGETGNVRYGLTRIGRFIERTGLHILPGLFSVLKGDMSLVGPRPQRIGMVTPDYILEEKPGLLDPTIIDSETRAPRGRDTAARYFRTLGCCPRIIFQFFLDRPR